MCEPESAECECDEPESAPPRSSASPPEPDPDPDELDPDDPEPDEPDPDPSSSWSASRGWLSAASRVGGPPGVDVAATTRPKADVTTIAVAARALRLIGAAPVGPAAPSDR